MGGEIMSYIDLGPLTRALNKLGDESKASTVLPFLTRASVIIDRAIADAARLEPGTIAKWFGRDEIPGSASRAKVKANLSGLIDDASSGGDQAWSDASGWSMGFVRRQITGAAVEANAIVQADATLQAAYQGMVDDIVAGIEALPAEVIAAAGKVVEKVSVAIASALPWWIWVGLAAGVVTVGVVLIRRA